MVELGREGESIAVRYLQNKGYKIFAQNYKNKLGEVDVVAQKGTVLVVVEVKAYKPESKVHPLEAITKAKQNRIKKTTLAFIKHYKLYAYMVRFDVVVVENNKVITHLESAFV